MNPAFEQIHSTGDEALTQLSGTQGALGEFVREYPGRQLAEESNWLKEWFQRRIEKKYHGILLDCDEILPPSSISNTDGTNLVAETIKLKNMEISYFRGFREARRPIDLNDDFIVIEGRNSSGKTSFAEALEWLFTGALSRRDQGGSGNARELDQCITNQFRSEAEETWVSATFVMDDQEEVRDVTLRRLLLEDYGTTSTAISRSVLYADGRALSEEEEYRELEDMFSGVPPILMQHTLRDFVQSEPRKRREYFERLLRLDELTEIIRRAIVGDAALADYPSPTGEEVLQQWNELNSILGDRRLTNAWRRSESFGDGYLLRTNYALTLLAQRSFPELLGSLTAIDEMESVLIAEQRRARLESFPILEQLRPQDVSSIILTDSEHTETIDQLRDRIDSSNEDYQSAKVAAEAVGSRNVVISRAFQILVDAGIVSRNAEPQRCPICDYHATETLSAARVGTIEGWNPIMEAESLTRQRLNSGLRALLDVVSSTLDVYNSTLPPMLSESQWDAALEDVDESLESSALSLRVTRESIEQNSGDSVSVGRSLVRRGVNAQDIDNPEVFVQQCSVILEGLRGTLANASNYQDAFTAVEEIVAREASADPSYHLREVFLDCIHSSHAIADALRWEYSKKEAQSDLEEIRSHLMTYRQDLLETKRSAFNDGIQIIWNKLRRDRYSSFSNLYIPPPRGQGFPVEFELKAVLDDNNQRLEVDALRVFSESQVNALGIAAFVTRSELLGHRMLVFDDPVQSMDEEHFKTFANSVVPHALGLGFQVILFTHNDTFARDLSNYHHDRQDYVTMTTRQSRRDGVIVEEGNRRVPERLKLAERNAEEGHLSQAWYYIRLAVERLYTITYIKYGPTDFKPEKWQDQAAEYMWNEGVDHIIESEMPGSGVHLKEILTMANAGGHDTPPRGETDLLNSTALLKNMLNELRLGG